MLIHGLSAKPLCTLYDIMYDARIDMLKETIENGTFSLEDFQLEHR